MQNKKREAPIPVRLYPAVAKWWAEFNKDGYWRIGQAMNLGLAKFMGKQDKEIEELHSYMRGHKDE
jgi:hypothetical protein